MFAISDSNKNFYKKIFLLVLPIAIQNLIGTAVSSADIIMLGKLNESAMSAVSIANQFQYIYVIMIFGISSGATVLNAQYWGKNDKRAISYVLGISILVGILVGLLFSFLAIFHPEFIMQLYTKDNSLIEYGAKYLRVVGLSYVIQAVINIYFNTMKSMERVVIATATYTISLLANIIINYCLIFGKFGFPEFGVKGAAIGTVCARLIEFLIVIIYSILIKDKFRWFVKDIVFINLPLFKDFVKYAFPIIINEFLWSLAMSMNTSIYGHIGKEVVAANSVAQVVRQLFMIVAFGLASGGSIVLGKNIGEHKFEKAKKEADILISLTVKICIFMAIILFFTRGIIIDTFILSDAAREYLNFMIIIICFYIVAQGYTCMLIIGVFRAGGDAKYGLFADTISMWAGSLLIGFLFAFILKLPVKWVIFALLLDEFIKVPICYFRYKQNKWLKDVTR